MRPYTSLSIKGMVVSLLMVFAFFIPRAAAQMRQLYKDLNEDNSIRKISFYSPSQGYVAFRDWIGFTSDSGRTFVKKYVTLTNVDFNGYNVNITFGFGINGVKAFNQHTIIAYGDYGLVPAILYSTNGGNTFELIYHSQFSGAQLHTGIMDMVFPENNVVGYAVDADRVLKTTDGGQSWFTARSEAGAMFEHLEAIDNNTVFAFSGGYATSKLLRTTNGGTAWSQVALPPGTLNCACFNTASKGWVNMNDIGGKIYYTTTGGSSWVQQNNELASFTFEKMKFVNESTGYAIGAAYNTYKTTDSGRIWERLPRSHPFTYLGYAHKDLQYFSNMQLWAGGDYGLLELGLNGGGMPIPAAYFMADTIGLWIDNTVQLRNYSKQGYQYAWYKNGVLISTAYHASYVHDIYKLKDTIQLVVSNGTYADTAVHYPEFYPPVIINEFSPVTAGGGATITLKGINFTSAVAVSFGGEAASFSVVSDSVITARVSTSGASGDVMVITPYGSGRKAGFTFIPAPVITSFAPASATAGTPITITGDHFTGATAVQFGGVPVTSFTVVSPTTIRAIPGAGSSGNVTVTTPGGISTMAGFTMIPFMSSFSPASGTIGEIVTIKGSGLTGVTGVSFGGVPAQSFTIDSLTGITAVVGAGGTGNVMITSPGGNASLPGFRFFL
ncbi:MAG TPA: IPT/TIG domain-containing protein, partial [Chitinophaga sp.]